MAIPVSRMKPGREKTAKTGAAHAAEILRVLPGSPAERANLQPGERILEINGVRPADLIDYLQAEASDRLHLVVAGPEGDRREIRLEKAAEEPWGWFLPLPFLTGSDLWQPCLFCFVDQMPPGFRKTLYQR